MTTVTLDGKTNTISEKKKIYEDVPIYSVQEYSFIRSN